MVFANAENPHKQAFQRWLSQCLRDDIADVAIIAYVIIRQTLRPLTFYFT